MKNSVDLDLWYQLCIEDIDFLSGKSVFKFLETIKGVLKVNDVKVVDAIGTFESSKFSNEKYYSLIELEAEVKPIVQFDWAFFLINHSKTINSSSIENEIKNSELTIRLADDTYFYVYCREKAYIELISKVYINSEITNCKFDELIIPW